MIHENTCAGFFLGGVYFEGFLFGAVQVCVAVGACLAAAIPVPWLKEPLGAVNLSPFMSKAASH